MQCRGHALAGLLVLAEQFSELEVVLALLNVVAERQVGDELGTVESALLFGQVYTVDLKRELVVELFVPFF